MDKKLLSCDSIYYHIFTMKILQVKLADPDVVSNPTEYQKLAQSMAELDEVSQ